MTTRRDFMKQAGVATAGLLATQLSLDAFAATEDKKFQGLRQAISSHAGFLKIPGLVAAVVENGQVTFVQTEGFADLDKKTPIQRNHIFPVASLSKTFAAVTLMQCEQEGKISMDDYVLDYPYTSIGLFPEHLQTPNIKIKHVLSHTSEGEPGSNYMYNGNRYNFVYGVFEKMSGNTKHYEAVADEVTKRIIRPLNLKDTLTGYPTDQNHPAIPRIVTTYKWDKDKQLFKYDKDLKTSTTLYPSSGLLTTIDDLAAYSHALDQHTLLNAESYKKLTTPFVTTAGRANPYGMGWSTQQIDGREVHWHYGYGDLYAALIIRIPQQKLSFILLSNGVQASEGFYLGYGNLLNSVFAQAFFKDVVYKRNEQFSYDKLMSNAAVNKSSLFYDEIFSQALMRAYTETYFNEHKGEVLTLIHYLAQNDPARFQRMDVTMIYLLAKLNDQALKLQMESSIAAYVASGWFHPEIHGAIAGWYELNNNQQTALEWYHKLADSKGYGEQGPVKNACAILGKHYLANGDKEKGRDYLWQAALYGYGSNHNMDEINKQVAIMNAK